MTWSLVVHDRDTGAFAVAVATCAFAVGANCPYVRAGVGAVSTQSLTNRYLGPAVLDGLARGLTPEHAIAGALAGDGGAHLRQVHAVDRHGRHAAWTGRNCVGWAGDRSAAGHGVAGNMLAGEAVATDTLAAYGAAAGDVPDRLLAAMLAGERAGGDRRGKQSAALVLVTTEDFPDLNLRVDDHVEPLAELGRLLSVWREQAAPGLATRPRKADPTGFVDMDAIEATWQARGLNLRFEGWKRG